MTTRTPGSWWFDDQFGEIKSERGVICRPGFSGSRVPIIENRANAFLISAAPDLLAALRALVVFYVDDSRGAQVESSPIPYMGHKDQHIKAAWLDAWRVIAKAEGRR